MIKFRDSACTDSAESGNPSLLLIPSKLQFESVYVQKMLNSYHQTESYFNLKSDGKADKQKQKLN